MGARDLRKYSGKELQCRRLGVCQSHQGHGDEGRAMTVLRASLPDLRHTPTCSPQPIQFCPILQSQPLSCLLNIDSLITSALTNLPQCLLSVRFTSATWMSPKAFFISTTLCPQCTLGRAHNWSPDWSQWLPLELRAM